MGLDLLKGVDDPSQLQLLKDTCATAFIGKFFKDGVLLIIAYNSLGGAETVSLIV